MVSRNYINYDLKHARKDGLKDFAWGTVNIRIGKTDYSADVIVGNNGTRLYLYDVINLKEIKIKERRSNHQRYSQNGKMLNIVASSKNSISQHNKNDNNILNSYAGRRAAEANLEELENAEKKNMLRENYKKEIDEWYRNTTSKERLRDGGRFLIGRTSNVLKSINVKDYDIYFGKSKIQKILNKHQDMDIGFIKQVPEILETPIMIMDSVTRNDSLLILGDMVSEKGEPVLVSLLVDPKSKTGAIEDFGIITSAYGKKLSGLQKIIDSSTIRYIEPNKKRTNKWLSALGLQLPSATTKYGSVNKITNEYQNVNDMTYLQEQRLCMVSWKRHLLLYQNLEMVEILLEIM